MTSKPRNVRNFWLEITVDGRVRRVNVGPRDKDGGFRIRVFQRSRGQVLEVGDFHGYVWLDNSLVTAWYPATGAKRKVLAKTRRD